jgi:hypothetical protein
MGVGIDALDLAMYLLPIWKWEVGWFRGVQVRFQEFPRVKWFSILEGEDGRQMD